ncbi:MAG: hypothetical protein ACRDWD_12475 [Acidimicrobiia bacterium]
MQIPLDWAEQQFRATGRRDAHDLAVELVASYQGSAVLTSALGQPELMARHPDASKDGSRNSMPDRAVLSTKLANGSWVEFGQ